MFTEADIIQSIMKRIVYDENGCWVWTGSMCRGVQPHYSGTRHKNGKRKSINKSVRKVLYMKFKDLLAPTLPKSGMGLRATCGNMRCVRPAHCEPAGRKLSLTQIKNIRQAIASGTSMTVLARKYDCSIQNIFMISQRETFNYS